MSEALTSPEEGRPLWAGLSGEDAGGCFLEACRCRHCGFVALGQRSSCPNCWAEGEMEPSRIGRRGRLYTRSVIHAAPPGYDGPYAVGYVDLEHGVRIFAHLENGPDAPSIGDEVELTIVPLRKDEKGRAMLGPRYRKAGAT